MKKKALTCLCLIASLACAGVAQAQLGISNSSKSINLSSINADLSCKISVCLLSSLNGGVVNDTCEGPLEVFFLQVEGTNKARFLASYGYDYDAKTNAVVASKSSNNNNRAYNAQTGKFEEIKGQALAVPKTPREELLSKCPSCTESDIDQIIAKYGETKTLPDLITQSDTSCEAILCLGGLVMGKSGGSACANPIAKYKSQVAYKSGDFSASRTADKRRSWLGKCGSSGTGDTINKIQDAYGRVENF